MRAGVLLLSFAILFSATCSVPADESSKESVTTIMKSNAAVLDGSVVKSGSGSITLQVTETYVTSVSRRGARYATKQVEHSFDLADKVVVKTHDHKESSVDALKAGDSVRIHLAQVKEGPLGEKAKIKLEATKIEILSNPTATAEKK